MEGYGCTFCYKESEDSSNSAIDNLPKINLDGESK